MKIALVQLGRIGDMILMTSGIKTIKKAYPNSEIYFISGGGNYFIVDNNPNVKQVLIYNKNPLKLLKFLYKLRKIKFDYYIDPKDHFSSESCFLARIAKSKIKIGYNKKSKKKCFDIELPSAEENLGKHFVERLQQSLAPIIKKHSLPRTTEEKESAPLRPELYIDKHSDESTNNYLNKHNIYKKEFIIINISASNQNKMWKEEYWIEFINAIKSPKNKTHDKFKTYILISEKAHFESAKNICIATNILHFPPADFNTIVSLISKSRMLISPDTSLIHVAAAFDLPVVALTCNVPWSVSKFFPLSSKKLVLLPKEINGRLDLLSVSDALAAYYQADL